MDERTSIIIVDNDTTLLTMLEEIFVSEGYRCETAASAHVALELIDKAHFDIMVTDIVMPGMTGIELTEKAKKLSPHIAAVVMTGFIDDFSYDRAIEAGASDFIKKPFTVMEVIARIKQVKMTEELEKRERELRKRVKELEEFYNIAVSRELRIKELKEEVEELKEHLQKYQKP